MWVCCSAYEPASVHPHVPFVSIEVFYSNGTQAVLYRRRNSTSAELLYYLVCDERDAPLEVECITKPGSAILAQTTHQNGTPRPSTLRLAAKPAAPGGPVVYEVDDNQTDFVLLHLRGAGFDTFNVHLYLRDHVREIRNEIGEHTELPSSEDQVAHHHRG